MKINIVGSILGTSGYDNHCKGLANAMYKLNPDIKLDVPLSPTWTQEVNDAELAMIKTEPRTPDVTIAIMTPPNWRVPLADNTKKFIGFCVWEGDKVPKYWIEYLLDERVDQIWVPSQHTKDAIITTLIYNRIQMGINIDKSENMTNKIKIVPHGYDPEIFKPREGVYIEAAAPLTSEGIKEICNYKEPFKFIVNKGWRGGWEDRGGVQYVLQAYSNEFKKDENVELLLKLNPAYINPATVSAEIDKLGLPKDCAKIKVACSNMPIEKIAKLYNESDVCVCATRAEAFDLGTAEAMACGLPVIATGFGGQVEHMDETCSDLIKYELAEVKGDVQYEGIKQAVPDTHHLQELLRAALTERVLTKKKGDNAKEFIKDFTWDKSAEKAILFLNEL